MVRWPVGCWRISVSDRSTLGVLHNSFYNSSLPAQPLACKLLILKIRRDVRVVVRLRGEAATARHLAIARAGLRRERRRMKEHAWQ
jgi:hypothetical protein